MKYIFLLQKEGTTGQTLYHFVPYKYGPFTRELYQDLEALAAEGSSSVTESNRRGQNRSRPLEGSNGSGSDNQTARKSQAVSLEF